MGKKLLAHSITVTTIKDAKILKPRQKSTRIEHGQVYLVTKYFMCLAIFISIHLKSRIYKYSMMKHLLLESLINNLNNRSILINIKQLPKNGSSPSPI